MNACSYSTAGKKTTWMLCERKNLCFIWTKRKSVLFFLYDIGQLIRYSAFFHRIQATVKTSVSELCCSRGVCTKYRTAEVGQRVRSTNLYHSRQCGVVFKPRPDGIGYSVVCFMIHNWSLILRKTIPVQAKCGLKLVSAMFCCALWWVQEKKPSRLFYIPWLAFLPLYIIYESAINIYFFYTAFSARLDHDETFILRAYGVSICSSVTVSKNS